MSKSDTRQRDQHDATLSKLSHNVVATAPTTTCRYSSALPRRPTFKACVLHHTDHSCTTTASIDYHPPWPVHPAVARAAGVYVTSKRHMATTATATVGEEGEQSDTQTKPKKRGRPRKPKAAKQHTDATSASAANTESSANTPGAKNKVATSGKPRRQGKGSGKKGGEGTDHVAAGGTVEGQATERGKRGGGGDDGHNENPAGAGNDHRRLRDGEVVPEAVVGKAAEAGEAIGGCDIAFDIGRVCLSVCVFAHIRGHLIVQLVLFIVGDGFLLCGRLLRCLGMEKGVTDLSERRKS